MRKILSALAVALIVFTVLSLVYVNAADDFGCEAIQQNNNPPAGDAMVVVITALGCTALAGAVALRKKK